MLEIIIKKYHQYIRENNPELLIQLEEDGSLKAYLSAKVASAIDLLIHLREEPPYVLEEACMELLTQDLRPSKYNYIIEILEEEFPNKYDQIKESGILKFEAINIINHCLPVFEEFHFSEENEDDNFLRYAILGAIENYWKK